MRSYAYWTVWLRISLKPSLAPRWLRLLSVLRRWFCCVDFLFIVTPIVGVCNCSMFCCMLLYVHCSIAISLLRKRELVALLNLSSWCLVMVERLFLVVPWGCLRFVIVIFPNHTHLLFFLAFLGELLLRYEYFVGTFHSLELFYRLSWKPFNFT